LGTANPHSARLRRWQIATLALLVFGYAGCYLCRSNLSVALPAIEASLVEDGYEPDRARIALGRMVTLGVLAYTLGKFITGGLADFLGGRRNMLGGMLGSVLFTVLFAAGGGMPWFTLAWFGNRAAQSLCWTGMVKITGRWFSYSAYGTAMGVISLSYLFGDAAARQFMGVLFDAGLGWREVFWAAAGVLAVLFALNLLWLRESPRRIGENEPAANPLNVYGQGSEDEERPPDLRSLLVPLVTSREFIVVCLLSLGLTLLRETFNTWSPTYFVEVVGSSSARAASQSALFPLLGGASVLVAGWLGDRLGQGGRAGVILGGCSLSVVVLWLLGSLTFAAHSSAPVWLVGLAGFLMLGPYSYLAGAISLDLGGKRGGATACGIIDGVGYLGAMMAGDSVARLSVAFGWSGAFRALAGVALLTSLAAAVFFGIQRRKVAGRRARSDVQP
jgi:OPA family glycerol-3-phosphate transporter-like MFS transporter